MARLLDLLEPAAAPTCRLTDIGVLTRLDAKTGEQTDKARICAGEKYELLDSNDLDEMALATPALVGDRLILRTANHVYSIRRPVH